MSFKTVFSSFILVTLSIFQLHAQSTPLNISDEEALRIGIDAYLYGYSLITSEITRVQMTNVASLNEIPLHAPMGQFITVKRYPPANYRGVSAPNADTLYSAAWIDVSKEPWVVSWPDMGKRFYLFSIYNLWMPVLACPGSRTTGQEPQSYAISGPNWYGKLPPEIKEIKSPTDYVFILARTFCNGTPEDYEAVNKLQDQYNLYPISYYQEPYTPPPGKVDHNPPYSMTDKVRDVINDMDIEDYFNMMAKLMGTVARPPLEDQAILRRMAKIGLIAGKPFELKKLSPSAQIALQNVSKKGFDEIKAFQRKAGTIKNGWVIPNAAGRYGNNYLARALIAAFGWPANLPEDAVYPYTDVDNEGNKLSGANKYMIRFEKGKLPPVDGFWSITMYTPEYFFYPNAWNKLTVSPRNNLKYNQDGSLDLYFQNEYPGKHREANWLPAPKGNFILMMRMYWPKEEPPSILPAGEGTWVPPGVKKLPGT